MSVINSNFTVIGLTSTINDSNQINEDLTPFAKFVQSLEAIGTYIELSNSLL